MFNRYWVTAIALGVAVQTAPLYAQQSLQPALQGEPKTTGQDGGGSSPSAQQATPEDGSPSALLPAIQGIESAIRELIAEEDKVAAEQRNARDQADLRAQENMALWAFWMFVASALSVFLTGVGVVLIWRTLHHSRRAADYAQDMVQEAKATTAAALKTVSVTEEIGERQLRPYLAYDHAKISVMKVRGENSAGFLEIDANFRNCGMNPAILTAASSAVYAPSKGETGWERKTGGYGPRRILIGPNQIEKMRFHGVEAGGDGKFTWFAIGILLWYESPLGTKYEESVWLTYDGTGLRQDYPTSGYDLYRPDEQ